MLPQLTIYEQKTLLQIKNLLCKNNKNKPYTKQNHTINYAQYFAGESHVRTKKLKDYIDGKKNEI